MNNKGNDSDSALLGSTVYFTTTWQEDHTSIAYPPEGRTVAADQLVLISNSDVFKDITAVHSKTYRGYQLYPMYAVADHQLTFDETKTLTMDSSELTYYGEKDTIPAGKHIVGILYRWRGISYYVDHNGNDVNQGGDLNIVQAEATLNDDASYADKVYSITIQSKLYDTSVLNPDISKVTTETEKADAYRNAAQDSSMLGDGPLCRSNSAPATEGNGNMDQRAEYTTQPSYTNGHYEAGGGSTQNYRFQRSRADSLYVVPYATKITKTVAQKDQNGNEKTYYDLDRNERYVDYKITGSINFTDNISIINSDPTTTITITDTIPSGLAYVTNSARWNPTSYHESVEKPGELEGGTPIEPEVITSGTGVTVLTWTIPNVDVKKGDLPPLYYTCKIDKAIQNSDQKDLTNTAEIHSSEEKRAICGANGNISQASISFTKSSAFNINKYGDHDLELNDSATFTLVASNATDNPKKNLLLVDAMPNNKDGHTRISEDSQYNVTGISINSDPDIIGVNGTDDIEIYYTDSETYAGLQDLNTLTLDNVPQWSRADKITENENAGEDPTWNVTGWPTAIAIYDPNLGAHDSIFAKLSYTATAASGDHLENKLMTKGDNETIFHSADVNVYDRELSGTVWIDADKDGIMESTEKKVQGVKVILQRENESGEWENVNTYKGTDGKTCNATQYTDSNGFYKFTKLPKGNYKVRFLSGNTKTYPASDLSQYSMTAKNAVSDTTVTSKTDVTEKTEKGELEEGDITEIDMPTIDEMKSANGIQHYSLPDQNMGLYKASTPTSTPENPSNPPTSTPETPHNPPTSTPDKPNNPPTSTPDKPNNPPTSTPDKPHNPPTSKPDEPHNPPTSIPDKPNNPPTSTPDKPGNPTETPTDVPKDTVTPTPNPIKPTDESNSNNPTPPSESSTESAPSIPSSTSPDDHNYTPPTAYSVGTPDSSTSQSINDSTDTAATPAETGDHTHAEIYFVLLILAGAFITMEVIRTKKFHHEK